MSGYLDRLEQQLIHAAGSEGARRGISRRRVAPMSVLAAVIALLVASAVALAVSGTFSTGSAVSPPMRPLAGAGAGIAAPGTRLLAMRVADPAGGLPWGIRLVPTTRGLMCVQVGRIGGSRLGVLGQDGAFGDDGRFHPVGPDVVAYRRSTPEISSCLPPGTAISEEAGIPQSGVFGASHLREIPGSAWRWISYGLLGPHAVSVTYRAGGRAHTVPVDRGSGAYLVVLPDPPTGSREVGGGASSSGTFITPQGAISAITYRVHGTLCSEPRPGEAAASGRACPRPPAAAPPGPPRKLHRPIGTRLLAAGGIDVTFTAPRTVASALSGYAVEVPYPCHKGTIGTPVERDVRAGEVVHVTVPAAFVDACARTLTVRVVYQQDRQRFPLGDHDLIVGETSVSR
jgi:hypothetical protein